MACPDHIVAQIPVITLPGDPMPKTVQWHLELRDHWLDLQTPRPPLTTRSNETPTDAEKRYAEEMEKWRSSLERHNTTETQGTLDLPLMPSARP